MIPSKKAKKNKSSSKSDNYNLNYLRDDFPDTEDAVNEKQFALVQQPTFRNDFILVSLQEIKIKTAKNFVVNATRKIDKNKTYEVKLTRMYCLDEDILIYIFCS